MFRRRVVPVLVIVCFAVPLAFVAPAAGQLATLARDLNTSSSSGIGSLPLDFHGVGGRMVFTAETPAIGRELWSTDGTPAGTELLVDACPGECVPDPGPTVLAQREGLLFFAASSAYGLYNSQLWATDGTPARTVPLLDPASGVYYGSSLGGGFFPAFSGPRLVFVGSTPERGSELWSSDGTPGGTALVADLVPGPESSIPDQLTTLSGQVFFFSRDPSGGSALWATDGTPLGTHRVAELDDPFPELLTASLDRLFFVTPGGAQLWVSDGTAAGTRPLAELPLADKRPNLQYQTFFLASWRDGVVFAAWDRERGAELWVSDGTPEGTRPRTDLDADEPFGQDLQRHELAVAGDEIFFFARDDEAGVELWRTDASPRGARRLTDACPGPCSGIDSESRLVALGGAVFFIAREGDGQLHLWRSDGTAAGTFRVTRRCDGCGQAQQVIALSDRIYYLASEPDEGLELWEVDASGVAPRRLTAFAPEDPFPDGNLILPPGWLARVRDRLLFTADDGVHGSELWALRRGQGPPRIFQLADLASDDPSADPEDLVDFANRAAFTAHDGRAWGVWTSSGRAADTLAATPRDPAHPCGLSRPQGLTPVGDTLFMFCGGAFLRQDLFATDGTPQGTVRLTELADHPQTFIDPYLLAVRGDELYFNVSSLAKIEIWRSDGTPAGTGRAFDLGSAGSYTSLFALREAEGAFWALTGDGGTTLSVWRSDGTDAGTVLLATAEDRFGFDAPFVSAADGVVLFALYAGSSIGGDLWRSDGTAEGTFVVATFPGLYPRALTRFGSQLYFIAGDGAEAALWSTDGTADGTVKIAAIGPVETAPFDPEVTRVGASLFFVSADHTFRRALWVSDGSTAGTRPVGGPGGALLFVEGLATDRNAENLYFVADDGTHGLELWTSDPSATEIRMVHDLAPGPASSTPRHAALSFSLGDDRLFFSADDGLFGRELWSLPLAPRFRGTCQPTLTITCLAGQRFQAEVAWRDPTGPFRRAAAGLLTHDTAVFSFTGQGLPKLVAKVLDGTQVNGHRWVFHGALTHLQHALTVTEVATGLTRRYTNPPGAFAAAGDTDAFGPRGASLAAYLPPPETSVATQPAVSLGRAASAGPCAPTSARLCLHEGRFAVETTWRDFSGRAGVGQVGLQLDRTGTFWFFRPDNVELMLQILDGTPVNGRYWVFYAALSNVEYVITVTDHQTGTIKTYLNRSGTFASVGDTAAF